MTHPIQPTVTVAGNGHVLIGQGFYKPALFMPRQAVPHFLADPASTPLCVLPPFAATALDCYISGVEVLAIHQRRNVPKGGEIVLMFRLRNRSIGFFSNSNVLRHPAWLAAQNIEVAVTPQAFATVGTNPSSVAIIAGIPRAEKPLYESRFALSPLAIRDELARAVQRAQPPLIYEN